ncbi:MAG: hypothetical protein JNM94_05310 [Phycisphaerae bacterium]|nr:hypothetical protein [Phycisphaerae bacterium]
MLTALVVACVAAQNPAPDLVVAISNAANADPAWKAVADALVVKHGGAEEVPVVTFDAAKPESLVAPLSPLHPRYLAVVVLPTEAGRPFVGGLHRAMRTLDADPYGDVRWGLITARTAAGAKALAECKEPLRMTRAAGTADFPMALFPEHWWWSEEAAHAFTMHRSDSAGTTSLDAATIGPAVAERINAGPIDLVMTGGHATEAGLELGFRKRAGRWGPKDGRTVVECGDGSVLPLSNTSPKAWIGVGNCLIGNVNGPDSAAATLIEDFGVRAHVGYVVVTWFGRGGWGTLSWFTDEPGRFTLNEAWFLNNQMIVDELVRRYPDFVSTTFDGWLEDKPEVFAAAVAKAATEKGIAGEDLKTLIGLLWDRDAVSYVGDPTWDARVAPRESDTAPRFEDRSSSGAPRYAWSWPADAKGVPPAAFLRYRLASPGVLKGDGLAPLVTDDFVIVREPGARTAGSGIEIMLRERATDLPRWAGQ